MASFTQGILFYAPLRAMFYQHRGLRASSPIAYWDAAAALTQQLLQMCDIHVGILGPCTCMDVTSGAAAMSVQSLHSNRQWDCLYGDACSTCASPYW